MPSRAVNMSILVLVTLEIVSGFASFLVGQPDGVWVFWLHRVGGFALVCLLGWKTRIAVRSYRRRGLMPETLRSALLSVVFLASLATAILWATVGLPSQNVPPLGTLTGLGVHVALSIALIPIFLLHVRAYWPRPRRADFASRRAALRSLGLAAGGLLLWRGAEGVAALASWSGARRRFTGSRELGSFAGNGYPQTNWLTDPIPHLDGAAWRLRVSGSVASELDLTLADLASFERATLPALLDCTGGWYTTQRWSGVPLRALIERAGPTSSAHSVVVHSQTGYRRRFALADLDRLLLATHVGAEPLSAGHGYPTRLVVPGSRGFEWVKWVVRLEVSDEPAWWQAPLPLR